jgi:hypothetical protein
MQAIRAEAVCRALGGFRTSGGFLCRCPVATHGKGRGDQSPSLSISDGHKGLVFFCFAGCEPPAIGAALALLDLSKPAAPFTRPSPKAARTTTADALALWNAGYPVAGTPAEHYLAARGLPLPPKSLRFLSNVEFSKTRRFHCLVAAMQSVSRAIVGVQLTFLHPKRPEKAPVENPRRVIGKARGAALRLAAAAEEIGLAEGYETAHAAMLMTGVPTWASCGSSRLPLVILPGIVRRVIVFADPDKPGLEAAEHFRERHPELENVEIRTPDGSDDYAAIYAKQRLRFRETV